jgi:hypothetical protein
MEQKDKQWSTKQYTKTKDRATRTPLKTQVLRKIFRHTFFQVHFCLSIITVFWRFHYIDFPHFLFSPVKFTLNEKNNKINKQKQQQQQQQQKKTPNKQTKKRKKKNILMYHLNSASLVSYVTYRITCYLA